MKKEAHLGVDSVFSDISAHTRVTLTELNSLKL